MMWLIPDCARPTPPLRLRERAKHTIAIFCAPRLTDKGRLAQQTG